jgi:hypothetical protein
MNFLKAKMQILRSICNEKTLIIVDNFDVSEDENLQKFWLWFCII